MAIDVMSRVLPYGIVGVLAFVGTVVFAGVLRPHLPRLEVHPPVRDSYDPGPTTRPGPQLVMVFVGSTSCSFATKRQLETSIERLRQSLQAQARASDYSFTTIGIATAPHPDAGYRYLRQFGVFDEVLVGRSATNHGIFHAVHEAATAGASTPQVFVIRREILQEPRGQSSDERLLVRMAGNAAILSWADAGGLIPLE